MTTILSTPVGWNHRAPSHLGRRLQLGVITALLVLFASTSEAANKHVLILHSVERGSLALDYFTGNFRVDLQSRSKESVTFTQFVVTPPGFGVSLDKPIVEFFRSAYSGRSKPDLVVTVGGAAAEFLKKNGGMLFPDSPVLYAAVDQRWLDDAPLRESEAAVAVRSNYPAIVDDMLQLFPETKTVFMVTGSGEIGRFWQRQLQKDFEQFRKRLTFYWSNQMTYQEILEQVSALPRNSAIFHLTLGTDAEGGAFPEDRVLSDMHAVTNAPMFAGLSPMLGHGIVGGRLLQLEGLPATTADVALRILRGESPADIKTPVLQPSTHPIFDGRELQRWGVARSRLPANSRILFQEPGVWERSKEVIVVSITAIIGQTALIAALLMTRRKRRRAERSLRESEGRFRVLANSAPVMIRLSNTDMSCTDINHQWLAFTGRALEGERDSGWFSGIHPDDRAGYIQTCTEALEHRRPFRAEYRLRQADGDYRWVLESSVPRLMPDGSVVGYIASAIDITELKAARIALSNLSGRLMDAQEQERARLARELHDDVGQRMSSLVMDMVRVTEMLPDVAEDAREEIGAVSDQMIALSRDIQVISRRLHSSKLDYLGLAVAAGSFCSEISLHHNVRIDYTHDGVPGDLPRDVALNLFRVLQEAVSNAVKYSDAQKYSVMLRGDDECILLEVSDDGRGFDVASAMGSGLGLISMQERLKLVNGDLVIVSKPGGGTVIRAGVPLEPAAGNEPHEVAVQL